MLIWVSTLASVLLVSIISLVGVLSLTIKKETLEKIIFSFVSLAAGTLLGDAFIHLIPESFEHFGSAKIIAFPILLGIIVFFILEKYVRWHHCHDVDCNMHKKHLASMNLLGDAVHNFIDGMLIAASYLIDVRLGIATTIAVIFHEIPQEIGDFAILIYSGYTTKKAILYNFLVATIAIIGAISVLSFGQQYLETTKYLIPFAAGGFLYIAAADLIPELHKERKVMKSLLQLILLITGILIMYLLALLNI